METTICVGVTDVVPTLSVPKRTFDFGTNPVPVIVIETNGDGETLRARIVGGEPDWIDPSLDEVRAGLDRLAREDRAEIRETVLTAMAESAANEAARLAPVGTSEVLGRVGPARSTVSATWFRIAAAVTLAVGIGGAWYAFSLSSTSGTNIAANGNPANGSNVTLFPPKSSDDQELDELMLLAATFDDGSSSEIDALFTETEKLDASMKSDWPDGGAM